MSWWSKCSKYKKISKSWNLKIVHNVQNLKIVNLFLVKRCPNYINICPAQVKIEFGGQNVQNLQKYQKYQKYQNCPQCWKHKIVHNVQNLKIFKLFLVQKYPNFLNVCPIELKSSLVTKILKCSKLSNCTQIFKS